MKTRFLFLFFLCLTFLISQAQVNLSFSLKTGGDDLRGGNDNLNIIVLLKDGNSIRYNNVNQGRKWNNFSVNTFEKTISGVSNLSDISGVRFETTFSGGFNGDNWNLDELNITGIRGTTRTLLLSMRGAPLFRFTGDQRVKDFLFSSAGVPLSKKMTAFKPEIHGFKFSNRFKNGLGGSDFNTSGLCGGMIYTAMDYYKAGKRIPDIYYLPASWHPVEHYIYERHLNSMESNADKWTELGFNIGGNRNAEFFRWGIQMGSGRLGELMAKIDQNEPVPLGLQTIDT